MTRPLFHYFTTQLSPGIQPGLPQHKLIFSAANEPMANMETSTAILIAFFIFPPAGILIPWVGKCLLELWFVQVALSQRVHYVWALGLYSFTTTLLLILLAAARWHYWGKANATVSLIGGGLMLVIAWKLLELVLKGRREYGGVLVAYLLLCVSQVIVALIEAHSHSPWLINLAGMGSWPLFVTWLTWQCWLVPPENLKVGDVAMTMLDDLRL